MGKPKEQQLLQEALDLLESNPLGAICYGHNLFREWRIAELDLIEKIKGFLGGQAPGRCEICAGIKESHLGSPDLVMAWICPGHWKA
ncbi:MAG: hypothetical protein J2P36_29020, partial [Ktedonobacteraceae bacterium]|nr:hypothetical protein [Ktedonobacteraceae bacterium]